MFTPTGVSTRYIVQSLADGIQFSARRRRSRPCIRVAFCTLPFSCDSIDRWSKTLRWGLSHCRSIRFMATMPSEFCRFWREWFVPVFAAVSFFWFWRRRRMAGAAPGQLNLGESPSWGSRGVDCFEKLEQIGEGTYGWVQKAPQSHRLSLRISSFVIVALRCAGAGRDCALSSPFPVWILINSYVFLFSFRSLILLGKRASTFFFQFENRSRALVS